jgi:hypothetical protein
MEKILLAILYISGKAFGWCMVSFVLLASLFVQVDYSMDVLGVTLILGISLLAISNVSYRRLLDISSVEENKDGQ